MRLNHLHASRSPTISDVIRTFTYFCRFAFLHAPVRYLRNANHLPLIFRMIIAAQHDTKLCCCATEKIGVVAAVAAMLLAEGHSRQDLLSMKGSKFAQDRFSSPIRRHWTQRITAGAHLERENPPMSQILEEGKHRANNRTNLPARTNQNPKCANLLP